MQIWHNQQIRVDSQPRKQKLKRFVNCYDTVKPYKSILGKTPSEVLDDDLKQEA